MSSGTRVMWMRGGTSKGAFFLADDVPTDRAELDSFLLKVMGSPDSRQIDGMGGADPLTSKVAIVSKSDNLDVDVDYRFLQVHVDEALVSDTQNCGNMLAAVAPFAVERGLVQATGDSVKINILMKNTDQVATAMIQLQDGQPVYCGDAIIDGVPGSAAPISIEFKGVEGSLCGSLLPSGNAVDLVEGIECTLIDNGMPCVIIKAEDLDITGYETREELETMAGLKKRIEAIRLAVGEKMNLGNVRDKTVPKMILVAPPRSGGVISTRCFIPKSAHASIGVFAAVSVATACFLEVGPAANLAKLPGGKSKNVSIEHPSGEMTCVVESDDTGAVLSAGLLRTARKLMDGEIFI